jgi:uncharacterized membrane protein required for colicin V production
MQLVIDVLLIAVFGLLVFCGWRRGFMKSILGLGRLILSVVITIVFGSSFAVWLDDTFINPPIYEAVFKKFSNIAADVTATAEGGVEALVEKIPDMFRSHLDLENLDPSAKIDELVHQWSHTVADGISKVVATVLGYILLFVLSFLVLTLVIFLVSRFAKLPFIKKTDKLLGLAIGLVSGLVAAIFLSAVVGAVLGLLGQNDIIEGSFMLRTFAWLRDLLFASK